MENKVLEEVRRARYLNKIVFAEFANMIYSKFVKSKWEKVEEKLRELNTSIISLKQSVLAFNSLQLSSGSMELEHIPPSQIWNISSLQILHTQVETQTHNLGVNEFEAPWIGLAGLKVPDDVGDKSAYQFSLMKRSLSSITMATATIL